MFISVTFKIVFEEGQYHNEQIKLEFRINEICFGSMYNANNFNLHGMLALLSGHIISARTRDCLIVFCIFPIRKVKR